MPQRPLVSVLTVNWNSLDDLLACLASVEAQRQALDDPAAVELVVVDNASADGSERRARRCFPQAQVIQSGGNVGFAEGCNVGINLARGRWIFTLNNDATLADGCLEAACQAARRAPESVGMLQLSLRFAHDPGLINSTGMLLFDSGAARDRDFGLPAEQAASEPPFCPTAGAALYRRRMLDRLRTPQGWFDAGYFMYMEDLDLGWRARLAGYDCQMVPEAQVHHRFQGSSRRLGEGWVIQQCRKNRLRALIKNASKRMLLASWKQTARDARDQWRALGLAGLATLAHAACAALPGRRRVRRLTRADPRALERRWCRELFAAPEVIAKD